MHIFPTCLRNQLFLSLVGYEIGIRGEPSSEELCYSQAADQCAVFIDNSNIFIEGQKYYARFFKMRVSQDPRCRIDIGNLVDLALGGRTLCYGKLYGSEPPALDTVWRKIREKGLDVDVFKKNLKGKEKEVETAFTADAVEYALESHARKHTVVVIAGDRDYCPLVKKLLIKKREWKVNLVAFEDSISSQMRSIKSANFEIVTLESLIQDHVDICCYVEARWRTELWRIPKNTTIILCFKKPLIPVKANARRKTEVNKLLKKCAKEITRIAGVPCCYHLCKSGENTSRWVYIVGCTWVKDEPDRGKIDFFRICRENMYQINKNCYEISELYENFKTMMESDAAEFALELENRFEGLDVEDETAFTDEVILSHIYDDEDSPTMKTESLDHENTESDGNGEVSDDEGFTEVKSLSEPKKSRPKYSTLCWYEFSCDKGKRCDHTHTEEQKDFFKANGDGKGRRGYKSKPCYFYFVKGDCKNGTSKAPNCAYYHSKEEARCYVCKNNGLDYIGHASHDHEEQ